MTSTPYVPNIIEQLQRNTQRKVALSAPDGMPFRDVSGDMVVRKRTEVRVPVRQGGRHRSPAVLFVTQYPPALVRAMCE